MADATNARMSCACTYFLAEWRNASATGDACLFGPISRRALPFLPSPFCRGCATCARRRNVSLLTTFYDFLPPNGHPPPQGFLQQPRNPRSKDPPTAIAISIPEMEESQITQILGPTINYSQCQALSFLLIKLVCSERNFVTV
jgi:hypothetical protein